MDVDVVQGDLVASAGAVGGVAITRGAHCW